MQDYNKEEVRRTIIKNLIYLIYQVLNNGDSPLLIQVSVTHRTSRLFSTMWLYITTDLLHTERAFSIAILNFGREGDTEKGS